MSVVFIGFENEEKTKIIELCLKIDFPIEEIGFHNGLVDDSSIRNIYAKERKVFIAGGEKILQVLSEWYLSLFSERPPKVVIPRWLAADGKNELDIGLVKYYLQKIAEKFREKQN